MDGLDAPIACSLLNIFLWVVVFFQCNPISQVGNETFAAALKTSLMSRCSGGTRTQGLRGLVQGHTLNQKIRRKQ